MEALKISTNAVSKWERGLCLIDISLLEPLSKILDYEVVNLINGEIISEQKDHHQINDMLKRTIEFTQNKKRNFKHKTTLIIIFVFITGLITVNFSYKTYFLNDIKELQNNLSIIMYQNDLKNYECLSIFKNNSLDNNYIDFDNLKINHNFSDFDVLEQKENNLIIKEKILFLIM